MKIQQKSIAPPISHFVFENKLPSYGVYQGQVLSSSTNKWDGNQGWLSPRRWKRKSWIFFGAYTPEVAVGFAIVDAGYLAKAFCYVYERQKDCFWQEEYSRPFGFAKDFEGGLKEDWQLGPYQISHQQGQWNLQYVHKGSQLSLTFREKKQGIGAFCPSSKGRPFHYTYKNLLLPTSISYKNGAADYQTKQALGSLDYSKGYPPRHTTWNWTSFMGALEDGTPLGINTVDGFNNNLENALWIGEEVQLLGKMNYQCQTYPTEAPWYMTAQNGQLKLQLEGENCRREHINLALLKSSFLQAFGPVQGQLYYQDQWQNFKGYGIMEDHEALW